MKEEPLSNEELQLFRRRDFIFRCCLGIPFVGFAWRLWNLQVKQGDYYSQLAKGNRIRIKSVGAPRGIIYDRNDLILSKNIPAYSLTLTREDTPNISRVLKKLSYALKIPLKTLQRNLDRKRSRAKFRPIQIYDDLTWRQISLVSAYQEEFPGISIEISPRRYYPYQKSGAHFLGYMNKINKAQLKKLPESKIMSARVVGQEGVEAIHNNYLIGADGGRQVEVDSTGRVIKTMKSIDPIPGADIRLALDQKLQLYVEKVMGERKGAAIVMNPHTGEVLSMVSKPSFDPNEFSQGMSYQRWQKLMRDPDHVLNNKCIQGIYSPGSTFKMIVAIAGLEEGLITPETQMLCEGYYRFKRLRVHCWKRSGHGNINVVEALELSCNIFFYKLGMELGIEKIREYANKLGLGDLSGVDLLGEKKGVIPSKAWKEKRYNDIWYPGDTLPASIGQGYVSVTPIQLLTYINSIANGGYHVKPRLVNQIINFSPDGKTLSDTPEIIDFNKSQERKKVDISAETLDIIREGMTRNVQAKKGTGRRGRVHNIEVAGKTGTTQVVSFKTRAKLKKEFGEVAEKYFNHAWFASFAPAKNPDISAVVFIENGESGSNAAALTRKIYEYYFSEIASPRPQPVVSEKEEIKTNPDKQKE